MVSKGLPHTVCGPMSPTPEPSSLPTPLAALRGPPPADVAETLVSTGAVSFRTSPFFRFTSGVESPVYVDNRRLLGHVAERQVIVWSLTDLLQSGAARDPGAAIAGTATAGIPWAAWMADRLDLPLLYVRSKAKDWGHERAVEGFAPVGARVVVVEDLAFSAGSVTCAATSLRDVGFAVHEVLTILSYDTGTARERLTALGLRHRTLTTIDAAVAAARRLNALTDDQASTVADWLTDMRGREA